MAQWEIVATKGYSYAQVRFPVPFEELDWEYEIVAYPVHRVPWTPWAWALWKHPIRNQRLPHRVSTKLHGSADNEDIRSLESAMRQAVEQIAGEFQSIVSIIPSREAVEDCIRVAFKRE